MVRATTTELVLTRRIHCHSPSWHAEWVNPRGYELASELTGTHA